MAEIRCSVFSKSTPFSEPLVASAHLRRQIGDIEFIVVNHGLTTVSVRVR